mmetsp:Transcript_5203/g.12527  ORF Transcript_5203/g.12527 Transcript_5203/m.12527 type:complete len:233 (+) Transcript_5203:117-815(+)
MALESWYDFEEDELSVDEYPFYKHTRSVRRSGKELVHGRHPRSPSEAVFGAVATPSEARLARWCVRWPHLWDCYSHEPQENADAHPQRMLRRALNTPLSGQVASMSGGSEVFQLRARTTSSSMYSAASSAQEEQVRPIRLINHLSFKVNEEHFKETVAKAQRSRSLTMSRSQRGFSRSTQNWRPTGSQPSVQVSQRLPELHVGLVRLGHKNRQNTMNDSQISIALSTPEEHD